jgi:hypothetical protein
MINAATEIGRGQTNVKTTNADFLTWQAWVRAATAPSASEAYRSLI